MKNLNWVGLGIGIFLGGSLALVITRTVGFDIGLSEGSIIFVFMLIFGVLGKKIGEYFSSNLKS
ncbi:hypothetical protein ACD631_01365 [Alteromonas macleodii]|uniref:hypothetical protein n=1 Tax=Alteromonas macleodii TaxID=28108 RepID=UPI002076798D|nr:hypothetical protein [Alteromonas macleodii]USI29023.1 hypothetical protein NFG60_04805 [Alteromonas macleodii]